MRLYTRNVLLRETEQTVFLICFPMKYRDFSVKINSENNSENTIFIFTVCKKRAFYEFSDKSLAQKVSNVVYLPEIKTRTLTCHDQTADVTY